MSVSARLIINNVRVFDGVHAELTPGHVHVRGDRIERVIAGGEPAAAQPADTVLDGAGRVLMPGLIDAHTHVIAAGGTMLELLTASDGMPHLKGLAEAGQMLMRGFTTVRDMAGDVTALKQVIDAGLFPGPRIYPSQGAISQTAGHGDFSAIYAATPTLGGAPARPEQLGMMRIADGPDRVTAAVREQLKKGASQIKMMAGGGVASSYDPLDVLQYTPDELRAGVQAAADWGTYVAVHVYTPEGIQRALDAGVRSIEHGHLADEQTIQRIAESGAWLSSQPFLESDHEFQTADSQHKNQLVCAGTEQTLSWAKKHGVRLAFGTDLLLNPAENHRQNTMLTRLTGLGFSPVEALRMATSGNAELLALSGARNPYGQAPLGVIRSGAWADMLLVRGDPTEDLSLLADPASNLDMIMHNGRIHRNRLS